MHPRDFHEAQCAIRIFEDYGMTVENKLGHWTVHYSDSSMHGQFYDSRSMYCAAVVFKEGVANAAIRASVNAEEEISADDLGYEIGDTFISWRINDPKDQWMVILALLKSFGYQIVRKK